MTNRPCGWDELNTQQMDLILETYVVFLKNRGIVTSRFRIFRLLCLINPTVSFEYKNGIIRAFELDGNSLQLMREISKPSNIA